MEKPTAMPVVSCQEATVLFSTVNPELGEESTTSVILLTQHVDKQEEHDGDCFCQKENWFTQALREVQASSTAS